MPRTPKPGMAWLHNVELSNEAIAAFDDYCQLTGKSRRDALEYVLSALPTFNGALDPPAWAGQIQEFIDNKQSFILNYLDSRDRSFSWTIRFAEFTVREGRNYLEFWAEETAENQDIEPLRHNWCVRLDRIVSVDPVPLLDDNWRESLDYVDVKFLLFGGLSYAYAKDTGGFKFEDLVSERLDENSKRVVRRITNTFWFMREVVPYADDCKIVSPSSVVSLMKSKIDRLVALYQYDC